MNALDLLLNRQSHPRLISPAPSGDALANIKKAATRVPDHAALTPWRFIVCEGEDLNVLGSIFEQAAIANKKDPRDIERASQLPLRAPMVIVAVTNYQQHPKVPPVEQFASASCAVMAMHMTAIAEGFQGIWRTGDYAHCPIVKAQLDVSADNEIVGFLYLGTAAQAVSPKPVRNEAAYFTTLTERNAN